MAAPNLKYMVSGAGFAVARPQSMVIPASTVVDTSLSQWAFLATVAPPIDCKSWLRKFEQGDKWSFCLTAGTLWPANQERP
jgi:hypothetical protein